ncbi:MAG TPA: flagellar basal-body rod protein FlgG [Stellaceae bacterium]|jgi:flagellar basal-body rod protein FlgG|nr:flagellar basal-body rod protein FlgG [Stellaceae bacterium]
MRAMNIAATGMSAQQTYVEVTANNIANLNTTAFKRQRPEFQDLLYQNERRGGATSSDTGTIVPVGVQIGIGVKTAAVYRITTQGNLTQTSNPLDVAIQGRGFFQILQPDGTTAYTRAGSFQLSPTGEIVTADGFVVQPGITLPQNTVGVTINASGQVQAQVAGQTTPQTVGQLQLANFANEAGLEALGNNLFQETPAAGSAVTGNPGAIGFGTINQGLLETSNVDVVTEITNLITAQRAYEMNSKVIQTADQMQSTLNQIQ